jgi:hypothetical protein
VSGSDGEHYSHTHPFSLVSKRLGLDFYHLKERLARSQETTSLRCSKVVNVTVPVPAEKSETLEDFSVLCEIFLPSGATARFYADCETLRAALDIGPR